MADIQTQLPIKVTDGTNTVAIVGTALKVDPSAVTQPVDSELPAAAALADGASNPTTPTVGAGTLVFNGTTWDRARGDTTNGLDVDVTRVSGNVTVISGQPSATTGTITTSSSTVSATSTNYTGALVSVSGTYSGVNFAFEASDDGSTWYSVQARRSDNSAAETSTGVLADNTSRMWFVYFGSATNFRVRATAHSSGTANIRITLGAVLSNNITVPAGSGSVVDTELPAAAALADAASNPTTPTVGAAVLAFNGTTWDRVRGDTTNGLDVDVTRVQGTVTVDSELPAAAALADGAANPTTPTVGAGTLMYNGSTWDRVRGDTTNGLDVDVTRVSGNVSVVGTGTAGTPAGGVLTVQGSASGTALPVSFGEVASGLVHHYATATSIANGSTGTITYTTNAGILFYLKGIIAAASGGPCKVTVDYGAGPTTVCVVFFSSAQPYVTLDFPQPIKINASTAVNVKILNNAGAAQDVYATIIGHEV